MGLIYALIVLSFFALIVINVGWAITNLYFFIVEGVQTLMVGSTFAENIYFSTYLKWILLLDAIWISSTLIFIFRRTFYKTDPKLHYLSSNLISEPEILAFRRLLYDFVGCIYLDIFLFLYPFCWPANIAMFLNSILR